MEKSFDAIVIGTGFGGSVSAWHLAKEGRRVLILERGRLYPPGDFPRSPQALGDALWDPPKGRFGLFNIWQFRALDAVTASGVGGGSLIYANVLIRKEVFPTNETSGEHWPIKASDLASHYQVVEAMLDARPYPFASSPYNRTAKTRALEEAARALGLQWHLPNLAVTFGRPGQAPRPGESIPGSDNNIHRRLRQTCRLCGECDIGCNYGAKNTLDLTLLSEACLKHSAELRPLSEVVSLRPLDGGGYEVGYRRHDPDDPEAVKDLVRIHAPVVVVAAGTFGSTSLLLRNRAHLPRLSRALGTRFSGNGDYLAYAEGCRETVSGKDRPRRVDPDFGPVITSTIRVPDHINTPGASGPGYYIQDGGWPLVAGWFFELTRIRTVLARAVRFASRYFGGAIGFRRQTNLANDIGNLLGNGGPSSSLLILLGMGRDVPGGRMTLEDDRLDVSWPIGPSQPVFKRIRWTMEDIAQFHGARLKLSPISRFFGRLVTAHPLGGCPMAESPEFGVVDSFGQVFGYPGLFVADGSVAPGPIGANPSLTIAALAHRFMTHANAQPSLWAVRPDGAPRS